jgi:hypothetical protein
MKIDEFISRIIGEAALDARIPDGMVDLKNGDHIQVVAETMYDICENEEIVNEFVSTFINEGKYPDRQAFNKDGWLVTFPSKEYRDAAIKRGTHAISDPTHGKGGMNLYYKRKGKQKRQTQQAQTAIQTIQQAASASAPKKQSLTQRPAVPTSAKKDQVQSPQKKSTSSSIVGPEEVGDKEPTPSVNTTTPPQVDDTTPTEPQSTPKEPPAAPKPADAPAIDVPVVTTPPEQYSSVSKNFASKKGWRAEPYGEYRDAEGNTVAVVGLSGEVVPIKSVDRDEYKIFAEKNMT